MSAVRRNGTKASYNHNQRGNRYVRTINGYVSDQIRAIEANSAGLSYDKLDARVSEAVRNTIRSKQTRINYLGAEGHYLEDEDDYDEPMAGDVEAASFGVHADTVGNMAISVDYETDDPNSPTGSIFDRLLRGTIRGPDSMYRNTIYLRRHGAKRQRARTAWYRNSSWRSLKELSPNHGRETRLGTT